MMIIPELVLGQKVPSSSGQYYRCIQPLGRGGNSHVYLVEATGGAHKGVLFALKMFVQITDTTRLGRFVEEIAFLKTCQHPAIMRIYDDGDYLVSVDGKHERYPFVVADYLPQTLYDAMRGGLGIIEKLAFALQLLSAASFMANHARCVVHRDIKPENIFVRGKSCILGDFGLLKFLNHIGDNALSSEQDRTFIIESTGPRLPRFYRTPDLLDYCKSGTELTAKSDVFQLGLVFCEMFTGVNPLNAPKKIYDDLILDAVGEILGSQGSAIRANLELMLHIDPKIRTSAVDVLDRWEGVFLEAVKLSHQLEGKIF